MFNQFNDCHLAFLFPSITHNRTELFFKSQLSDRKLYALLFQCLTKISCQIGCFFVLHSHSRFIFEYFQVKNYRSRPLPEWTDSERYNYIYNLLNIIRIYRCWFKENRANWSEIRSGRKRTDWEHIKVYGHGRCVLMCNDVWLVFRKYFTGLIKQNAAEEVEMQFFP